MTRREVAAGVEFVCFSAVAVWVLVWVYLVMWQLGALLTLVVVGIAASMAKDA